MNRHDLSPDQRRLLTRRDVFLKAGALAAAAATADLVTSGDAEAADKAPKIIVGAGDYKYECIHDWLMPPSHIAWGDTQGVAQDTHGRIYISHTVGEGSKSDDAIAVFDKRGNFLKSFGARFKGGGHGLDIRKEGRQEFLYHCDTAHRLVVKTDLDGKVIWEKGTPNEAHVYNPGDPFIPTNVALAPGGDFYITDGYGSDWITRHSIDGQFLGVFGGKGSEPGKVANAHGIWVDSRGDEPFVVVADRANHRLQYFTMDGKHVKFVTDGMRLPCHFDIQDGKMLIPDLDKVVTILDEKNKVVAQLGDGATIPNLPDRGRPRQDFVKGKFVHPHSAKFLNNGDILVVEWLPIGRVTLLKKLG